MGLKEQFTYLVGKFEEMTNKVTTFPGVVEALCSDMEVVLSSPGQQTLNESAMDTQGEITRPSDDPPFQLVNNKLK